MKFCSGMWDLMKNGESNTFKKYSRNRFRKPITTACWYWWNFKRNWNDNRYV